MSGAGGRLSQIGVKPAMSENSTVAVSSSGRGWPLLTRIFAIGTVLVATVFTAWRRKILIVGRRLVLVFRFLALRSILPKRRSTRHRWRLGIPRFRRVGLLDFSLFSPLTPRRRDIVGHSPAFSRFGLALGVRVRLADQPGQFRQRVIRVACRGARALRRRDLATAKRTEGVVSQRSNSASEIPDIQVILSRPRLSARPHVDRYRISFGAPTPSNPSPDANTVRTP